MPKPIAANSSAAIHFTAGTISFPLLLETIRRLTRLRNRGQMAEDAEFDEPVRGWTGRAGRAWEAARRVTLLYLLFCTLKFGAPVHYLRRHRSAFRSGTIGPGLRSAAHRDRSTSAPGCASRLRSAACWRLTWLDWQNCGHAEAQVIVPGPRPAPAADRRTAAPGVEPPAAAPDHPVAGPLRPSRI